MRLTRVPFALALLALSATVPTPLPAATPAAGTAAVASMPPDEQGAKTALDRSPRHGEFQDVRLPDGTPLRTWISYPERRDKAGVVLVIHEIYGLSDWIRGVADQLAADGFIAVAPDLVSGLGPGGGGTDSAATRDDVVKMVRALTPEMARARLDAVHDWAVKLPAANGRAATVGFCWGGSHSFAYAAHQPKLRAAVVYYGSSPDSATLAALRAPVLGLYGGDDARVNVTIDPARRQLDGLKRSFEPHLFEGAGHGFLRQQTGREGANQRASADAWPRTVAFLRRHLE